MIYLIFHIIDLIAGNEFRNVTFPRLIFTPMDAVTAES